MKATLALLAVLIGCGNAALAQQSTGPIPHTYFGMHIHRILPNELWREGGFGAVRLHDANLTWADLEPVRSQWDFRKLDAIVSKLEQAGKEILLPLQATPTWASSQPTREGAYGMGASALPRDQRDWLNYVTTVVSRYRGRIAAYSVWNEPNLRKFYAGSPEALAQITVLSAKAVRDADPSAKIVCSGITGAYGIDWFRSYLEAGAGHACDVIAYHFYTSHQPPERMLPIIRAVRQVMSQLGLQHKPLWNTETGWLVDQPAGVDVKSAGFVGDVQVLDAHTASSYVVRALTLGWANGVDRFYWYSWDHQAMGLTGRRGIDDTDTSRTYAAFVNTLTGASVQGCSERNQAWSCRIRLRNGDKGHLVWVETGTRALEVEPGTRLRDFANTAPVARDRRIGGREVLILGQMPYLVLDP